MPGMGSGVPVGAPPTVRTAIEPNLRASPIRTRHGCSYNQYPALGFNARNRDLVLPVGPPPAVRTAIEPILRASPIRTRHGCSYNQYPALGFNARKGIWRTCRYSVKGQAFMCSSLNNCEESKAVSSLMHAHIPVRYFLITAHWACIFFLPRDTSAS